MRIFININNNKNNSIYVPYLTIDLNIIINTKKLKYSKMQRAASTANMKIDFNVK